MVTNTFPEKPTVVSRPCLWTGKIGIKQAFTTLSPGKSFVVHRS
jgi:hypothetical protein